MESPAGHRRKYAEIASARKNPEIREQVEEILASAETRWSASQLRGTAGPSLVATQYAALIEAGLIKP